MFDWILNTPLHVYSRPEVYYIKAVLKKFAKLERLRWHSVFSMIEDMAYNIKK